MATPRFRGHGPRSPSGAFGRILAMTARLRRALDNPTPVLKQIGALAVKTSRDAFREQRFGTFAWPRRYPNQSEPILNIAGALDDLSKGPRIKDRRFEARPALIDTGQMRRSPTWNVETNWTLAIGTNDPKAAAHQRGDVVTTTITQTMRDNLAAYLKRARRGRNRLSKGGDPARAVAADERLKMVRRRLGFIFKADSRKTKLNKRPFLGWPDVLQKKILATLQAYYDKAAGRGGVQPA
jgi:phage gpG-like protein